MGLDYRLHLAITTGDVPMLLATARACAAEPSVEEEEPWAYTLCQDIASAAPCCTLRDDLLVWTRYGKNVSVDELLADLAPFLSCVIDDEHRAVLTCEIDGEVAEAYDIALVTEEEHEAWPRATPPGSGVAALDAQRLRTRVVPVPGTFGGDEGFRRLPKLPATACGGYVGFVVERGRRRARPEARPDPIADPLRDLDAYLAYVGRAHDDYATWGWNGVELSVKQLSRRVARLPEACAVVWSPGAETVGIRWSGGRARAFVLDYALSFDPALLPR